MALFGGVHRNGGRSVVEFLQLFQFWLAHEPFVSPVKRGCFAMFMGSDLAN